MKAFKYCIVLMLLLITSGNVNAQEIEWAEGITGPNPASGKVVTANGKYVYHAGSMGDQTLFGEGNLRQVTLDGDDYVARFTHDGGVSWVKTITGSASIHTIDVDGAGNVYIAGSLTNPATFGAGELTETTIDNGANFTDMFLAKYSASGVFQWVRQAGDVGSVYTNELVVDSKGNSYVVGSYLDNISFGADGNTPPIDIVVHGISPDRDAFIVKYDNNGDVVWAQTAGGDSGNDAGQSVTLDDENNVLVAGYYDEIGVFGDVPGAWINLSSEGKKDAFLAKYTSGGDPLWAVSMGGDEFDEVHDIAYKYGDIIVAGQFRETAVFESTNGVTSQLNEQNTTNLFFARYTSAGVLEWVKGIYAAHFAQSSINVGFGSGNQNCIASNYLDEITFGFGELTNTTLTSPGDSDQYFACFSSTGTFQWVEDDPTPMNEAFFPGDGSVLVTGVFEGNVMFGPLDPYDTFLTAEGFSDGYLAKYEVNAPGIVAIKVEKEERANDVLSSENMPGFTLEANYPNPFNPQTTIRFGMQEAALVSLKVYDMAGREVASLVNGPLAAGSHEVTFEAGSLPSGRYLYRLASPVGELTGMMSLIK